MKPIWSLTTIYWIQIDNHILPHNKTDISQNSGLFLRFKWILVNRWVGPLKCNHQSCSIRGVITDLNRNSQLDSSTWQGSPNPREPRRLYKHIPGIVWTSQIPFAVFNCHSPQNQLIKACNCTEHVECWVYCKVQDFSCIVCLHNTSFRKERRYKKTLHKPNSGSA